MDIVSIETGRATQLFLPDEVRSERDMYLPQIIELFQQRYDFTGLPTVQQSKTGGAKFLGGKLQRDADSIAIDNLDIYSDGIVAVCRSTDLAEIVLDDVITWGMATFGMRAPTTIIPRTYASFAVVDFKTSTSALIERFAVLQKLISDSYEHTYKKRHDFEVSKTSFAVDPLALPPHTNTEYLLDRRGGAPYGLNRYFCAAPLRTQDHIELLAKIEGVFVGNG